MSTLSATSFWTCEEIHPAVNQQIVGRSIYEGDHHGDFKGDLLVILNDGSSWKIHPKDTKMLAYWEPSDQVHIAYRKSHFHFKREHKFFLRNQAKGEEARVILIEHKEDPLELKIVSIDEAWFKHFELRDYLLANDIHLWPERSSENSLTMCCHRWSYGTYYAFIILSDGSLWLTLNRNHGLDLSSQVYVGIEAPPK